MESKTRKTVQSRTWFTENTYVRGPEGWLSIDEIDTIEYVMTFDLELNKFVVSSVKEFNIINYTNTVTEITDNNLYLTYKSLILPDDPRWQLSSSNNFHKDTLYYEGKLFNIVTTSNTLITRNYYEGTDNKDNYIVSLCHVK